MMPKKGQYVRVYFNNGMQLEGTVEEWGSLRSGIKVNDGESVAIIVNTDESVAVVQIFNQTEETKVGLREHMDQLEDQFQETYELPSVDQERIQKLADLRKMMQEQEKRIVKEQVVNHTITSTQIPNHKSDYQIFFKK